MKLYFPHGLGDCINFAHVLALYTRRGHHFTVTCTSDKHVVFKPAGVDVTDTDDGAHYVQWFDAGLVHEHSAECYWQYNKAAINVSRWPLSDIGPAADLWPELCAVKLDIKPFLPAQDQKVVQDYLETLPRPIIVIHAKGNTNQENKSIPDHTNLDIYQSLLDQTDGTLILLDWDNRVPRLANYRVRHMTDDWQRLETTHLLALLHQADLILGVDSGPLMAARFTDTPTVGFFPNGWHYPCRFVLPRDRQVNVVAANSSHLWNRKTRITYNIVECPGEEIQGEFVANTCVQMLAGPRYLGDRHLGADVQMQQFVRNWEKGHPNHLSLYTDRHRSNDYLLQEIGKRFLSPAVVETGCIRAAEDWRGAGYGTYLMGAFLHRYGGKISSVDIDEGNCAFARMATREMPCVSVICQDSVSFLAECGQIIDVLLLDSVDTEHPMAAEHALREIQAALPRLHAKSLVVFDDTVYRCREFTGKGALAVPWLLDQGWRVLYSGYQTICDLPTKAVKQ